MWSLFIDTHYKNIVIALYQNENLVDIVNKEVSKDHSVFIMHLLEELLKKNKITVHDLNKIYVCKGPGSFTGIRLCVTIAKTLAYTLNIPIKSLTSIELVSLGNNDPYLVVSENNGVFIAERNDLDNIKYYSKSEYQEFKTTHEVSENLKPAYEKIPSYLKNKPNESPHAVNPLYIKGISGLDAN